MSEEYFMHQQTDKGRPSGREHGLVFVAPMVIQSLVLDRLGKR
jgi:hypothetical protein